MTGVADGASYAKSSVPTAACAVVDTEDGNSTIAASLSMITGPYATDGIGSQTANCSYTDAGGLTANASATYAIVDPSAPSITPNISGTLGYEGWYTSDVTVSWIITDNESAISSSSGCDPITISTDTVGITITCSATSAGGNASNSVTIKRDATAPLISFQGPLTSVWYRENVTAIWNCQDATSDAAFDSVSAFVINQGSAVPAVGRCVDNAGNSAFDTQYFKIDQIAPTITGATDHHANGNGWYKDDVIVTFTCMDAISGIAFCSGPSQLGEGEDQSVTGTATDNAGLNNSTTVSGINIDKTAPTISGAASPAANAAGWNNTDVTVSFTCADSLSGVDSCEPNQTLSGEGAGQSVTCNALDMAGNSASTTISGINIAKTAPAVAVTGVTNGAIYTLGSVPAAGCNTSDVTSGVATNATVSFSGGSIGSVIASCSGATDVAGNSDSASVTYNVIYNWNGFFQPVDMNATNTVKAGSAIPVKFSLGGDQGLGIFDTGYPKFVKTSCTPGAEDAIESTVTAGGSSLTYDALAGQYIYIWKTEKSWVGWCGQLQVKLIDGTLYTAQFKFK